MTAHTRRRTRRFRSATALLGAALVSAALAACSSSSASQTSSSSAGSITLYSGQHEQTTNELVAGFEKATGIAVNVRSDDEDTLANQIVLQGQNSPADVFYTENSPALAFLEKKALLAPVASGTLAKVPAKYSSAQGDWLGVSARVSVLIYNPKLIKANQLPTSVLQLADSKYQGKIAFAAGETDFQPI